MLNLPRRVNKNVSLALTEGQLKSVFSKYDKNKDGLLDKKELKKAFRNLGAIIPGWRADRAISNADDNGDGYISEAELDDLVKYAVRCGYYVK